ncbi:MAG: EF-hand domain-containing protein [Pirellulaceae bacterium]
MRGGGPGGGGMGFVARLDANGNGMLDPEESEGRARMFLERTGLDLSRPIPLDQVSKAFEEMRNRRAEEMGGPGRGEDRDGEGRRGGDERSNEQGASAQQVEPLVPGFGEPDMFDAVPGFGDLGEKFAVAIEEQDLQEAQRTMGRSDTNQDGILDAEEIRNGRWGDDPLQTDRNRDGKLTLNELALRYAVRRVAREGGSTNSQSSNRTAARGGAATGNRRAASGESDRARGSDRMLQLMFARYDRNQSGELEKDEWSAFPSDPSAYDANRDGKISRDEFPAAMASRFGGRGGGEGEGDRSRWYSRRQGEEGPPRTQEANAEATSESPVASVDSKRSYRVRSAAERLADFEELPEWFARADANGDGQVKMAEYSTAWTDSVVADFAQFDLNGDGIVTPGECIKATETGAVQGATVAPASSEASVSVRTSGRRRGDDRAESDPRTPNASAEPTDETPPASDTSSASGEVPQKYIKYAVGFIKRYDTNKDGVLTQDEWTKMNTDYSSADVDNDGRITPAELGAAFIQK